MIIASELDAYVKLKHGFFTREGGVSSGVYKGLNCGYGSGDDNANIDQNRSIAMAKLGISRKNLNTIHQIHSSNVVVAQAPWSFYDRPKADAIVTDKPGLAIGIMTADCTPVLFADPYGGVIGAAHAGWKGAFAGVLSGTVEKMEQLGADRAQIIAAVGPCIHQGSYEVGPEFINQFLTKNPKNSEFFIPSSKDSYHLFDLPGFVLSKLNVLGLSVVQSVSEDTYADENKFYSYRRATHAKEADYGRCISAIILKNK
jgi:YfiH family protein